MKYTSEQISQINNAIPIVDYASQYLEMKQGTGRRKNEYWCICPFHEGDVNPSMSFNSDKNVFRCMGCNSKGYLISFVMQYHKLTFLEAIEHILRLVNINFADREYSEILEYLKKYNIIKEEKLTTRKPLRGDVMKQYVKEPIKEWLSEGILQQVLDKYDVRYDKNGNAIVFPIRDINGKIIAIKARTLYENFRDLGITKYQYYSAIGTNDFLFGLYENIDNIKAKNELILLEGAKGVMLAESCGYDNCVSLETNTINEIQMDILLQLKVDIVICLDKGIKIVSGKTKNISEVSVGLLPKLTNVYVIEDKNNLLSNKDCPADKGKEIFDKLYEGRYKI